MAAWKPDATSEAFARLRDIVARSLAETRQSHVTVREFGLVALGVKPASLGGFVAEPDGRLWNGFAESRWHPADFLRALEDVGLAVLEFPSYDSPIQHTVVVAPTMARAQRVKRLLATIVPLGPGRERETAELRLGALIGHDRAGCEAYLGRRPRVTRRDLREPLGDDAWFADGVFARDEPGYSVGIATIRCWAATWRAAFGEVPDQSDRATSRCPRSFGQEP